MNHKLKPRHCMVVYSVYPLGETRVQREAEALLKHGYAVDVICVGLLHEPRIDEYKGVRIFRENDRWRLPIHLGYDLFIEKFIHYLIFFVSAAFRLTQLHNKVHYDSIQVHNLPDFLVFTALVPKLKGVPIILDLHDLMPEFYAGRTGKPFSLTARLIRWQERVSCRFADHIITVSEHWRATLIQRGVSPEKCSVVMNVADESIFHPQPVSMRTSLQQGFLRLIYHGTLVERYGIDLIIQAVNQVRHEIPGIHLTLVGYGDFLPKIHGLINALDLQNHVTINALLLAEELPDTILSCDLGVVAYRDDVFTDGLLPTKLMEYAALGMPAIAARTTAIEHYFQDTMVEFFEPGNLDDLVACILRLYRNPERLILLRQGCERFTKRYNWSNISSKYVHLVSGLRRKQKKQVDIKVG